MQAGHQMPEDACCIFRIFGYFAKVGVEEKFGQKSACLDMATFFHFFQCLKERITLKIWTRFGCDFGRSKYLVTWLFEQIDELKQAPSVGMTSVTGI